MVYASPIKRAIAATIDDTVVSFFLLFIYFFFRKRVDITNYKEVFLALFLYCISTSIWIYYQVVCLTSRRQATIGMRLMNIKAVSQNEDEKLDSKTIIFRSLIMVFLYSIFRDICTMIGVDTKSSSYVLAVIFHLAMTIKSVHMIYTTKNKIMLHDSISKVYLVQQDSGQKVS